MVEKSTIQVSRIASETTLISHKQAQKFKFCYIVRGLPGTGKSTVAAQLAGPNGVVINLDTDVIRKQVATSASGDTVEGGATSQDSLFETQEKHLAAFCAEVKKGTPVIVVDNNNIKESEYLHFIHHAQQEHYIASIVSLPPPLDLEDAVTRSTDTTSVDQASSLLSMFAPSSLEKLAKKGVEMHEASSRSSFSAMKGCSPRGGCSPTAVPGQGFGNPAAKGSMQRRASNHFREVPVNSIPENAEALDEQDSSEEQEEELKADAEE